MKKIVFTGGGSAGHVTVNMALFPRFQREGWSVVYVGSEDGIEKSLVEGPNVRYIGISSGKLRRYFDWKNVSDPFRVVKGTLQAWAVLKREAPSVVFSKGGFVSVPVVVAAWLNKVPVVLHESDVTLGLANRMAMPFAQVVCTTFKESERYLPKRKVQYVGPVIREALNRGDREVGRAFCHFADHKPILLVMGGSLGAAKINAAVRGSRTELTKDFNVMHLCGKGQVEAGLTSDRYRQYEYLSEELPHVLAATDIVVSRAGANSIFEFLQLRKPMLLIPLTKEQSRGDQILNAQAFESSGLCRILYEERMNPATLVHAVHAVYAGRDEFVGNMIRHQPDDALARVASIITTLAKS